MHFSRLCTCPSVCNHLCVSYITALLLHAIDLHAHLSVVVSDSKTTKATNPIFVEMSNVVEASVSLTKRGSYILATEEGDVLQSGADGVAKAINEDSSHDEVGKIDSNDKQKRKPINFFRAFLLPGVIVVRKITCLSFCVYCTISSKMYIAVV